MSTNTLASAVAAARKGSLVALRTQSTQVSVQSAATIPAAAVSTRSVSAGPLALSNAEALMIAIQRSARTVDDIMPRRMLLAAGNWGVGR